MAEASSWVKSLQQFNTARADDCPDRSTLESRVKHCLRDLYKEEKKDEKASSTTISRFFTKKREPTELKLKIRKESRTRFLERKEEELMDEKDLAALHIFILDHSQADTSATGADKKLNYDNFLEMSKEAPERARPYFRPKTFSLFPTDEHGYIRAQALHQYICKKVRLAKLRINLTCYDEIGAGYLREQDLENYVFEQIPLMSQLSDLEKDFYPYYVFTAVRKFIFFLDPMKKGKIRIRDLMHSPIMNEFQSLRNPKADTPAPPPPPPTLPTAPSLVPPVPPKKKTVSTWFTSRSALQVYATYINLDSDHNGMLSKKEFMRYGGRSLTPVFVERLFDEYRMYKSKETNELEMDYKTYLDFVLAMEYKSTPQALAYFWKILDMDKKGYVTVFTLNYFFRAVCQRMVDLGHEPVDIADVVANEIFDMVRPEHPHHITLVDLERSKCGHTIISILTDVNGFWKYDNREVLIHEEGS